PPPRNRWFADSLLEGNGFEISVPRQIGSGFDRSGGSAAPTVGRPQPDRSLGIVNLSRRGMLIVSVARQGRKVRVAARLKPSKLRVIQLIGTVVGRISAAGTRSRPIVTARLTLARVGRWGCRGALICRRRGHRRRGCHSSGRRWRVRGRSLPRTGSVRRQ